MAKRGRPAKEFDLEQVRKLGALGCTDEEIAAFFDCCRKTIYERKRDNPEFLHALEKGRGEGKMSLRRLQWTSAQQGKIAMQIWLGKQLLGQRDHARYEHTGADGGPIQISGKERLDRVLDRIAEFRSEAEDPERVH